MNAPLSAIAKPMSNAIRAFTATGLLQRKCACGGNASPSGECEECRKKPEGARLQRSSASNGGPAVAPSIVHEVLRSPGQSLDAGTRAFMEPRFGQNFGNVRVHTDSKAVESARAVNALAYTVGKDVVFGEGHFAPNTSAGRGLLAHELTHVLQQAGGGADSTSGSLRIDPDNQLESQAEGVGKDVAADFRNETLTPAHGVLQRKADKSNKLDETPYIKKIVVDQATQTVEATFTDGDTISGECSTGKGHCCFDDSAGTAAEGACSRAESRRVGTNCTPIGDDFFVTKKIPTTDSSVPAYWTQFHDLKSVALHQYSPVDGTPLSHGCVRLKEEFAREIHEGARDHRRTQVIVKNPAKPLCTHPALQAEWKADFDEAGIPRDGEAIQAHFGGNLTKKQISKERRHILETRKELRSAFRTNETGLDAELTTVSGGAPIESRIPRCGETTKDDEPQGTLQRKSRSPARVIENPSLVVPVAREVLQSDGQPLDSSARDYMESRLGHNFGNVRVHADQAAGKSAAALGAEAFTFGSHVVFGNGQYSSGSEEGKKLIAHELVHVLQQRGANASPNLKIDVSSESEEEAESVSERVVKDIPARSAEISPSAAAGTLQRSPVGKKLADQGVPTWDMLPAYAQSDLASRGYDEGWFKKSSDGLRMTVLNLYVKLNGLGLWKFVGKESGTTNPGNLEFSANGALKALLRSRTDFSAADEMAKEWSARENQVSGQLHFKSFSGWPENKFQVHIDQFGYVGKGFTKLLSGIRHLSHRDSYLDVYGIRELLLNQHWDPVPLIGVQAAAKVPPTKVTGDKHPPSIQRKKGDDSSGVTLRLPAIEEFVTQESALQASVRGRTLSPAEQDLATGIFGNSIDYSQVRLMPSKLLEFRTVANTIRVPQDFTIKDSYMAQTYIHEMTHVWQYQHGGTGYMSKSLVSQAAAAIRTGNRNNAYLYSLGSKSSFFGFGVEQQGLIVENYFSMLRDRTAPMPPGGYVGNRLELLSRTDRLAEISRELPLHEPLIRQLRSALPKNEAELLNERANEVINIVQPGENQAGRTSIKPVLRIDFP